MKTSQTRALSKAKADRYFSAYIRKRDGKDGICKCITCGKYKADFDCGHMISRRFEATRFDEQNANGQCHKCNRFENGNQLAHAHAIDMKHGEGTSTRLLLKSRMLCKRTQQDYERIAEEFKAKAESL